MKNSLSKVIHFRHLKARRSKPLLNSLRFNFSSYHANTRGLLSFGSAGIISKGFAYLMNNKITGNYGEFGVYKGDTFLEAISLARLYGQSHMRFMAFDSFSGLPEVKELDSGGVFHEGQFSFSQESFLENLSKSKVDFERIKIYPGFFDQTLPTIELKEMFSFAFVDCDLYISTVSVLRFLEDKLVQGAILAFDDWYCFDSPNKGVRKAVYEWLEDNKSIELIEYDNFHWAGKSFIVNFHQR